MAPDTWKGLYESTLEHAKSGRIPMARLDDAVRRILRVKINSGIFEKPKPSARPLSGQVDRLGSTEHRQVAREAVRKSQVLLKNNNQTLPLATNAKVHVVGKGADHIGKFAGGWTLSWQGGEFDNSYFPNGESFLSAVKREVESGGGSVTYDETGENIPSDADVIIAVYGEDPYAEFRGDRENVDFVPNDFDTSDAFVASWLPGSEPAGITDLLFDTSGNYDFTGRLSFSWPKLATQVKLNKHHEGYDPLFALGYGLSLKDDVTIGQLSEDSGLVGDGVGPKGIFFEMGVVPNPWSFAVNNSNIDLPYNQDGVSVVAFDKAAQEDAAKIAFSNANAVFAITSGYDLDYQRETNGEMELSFETKRLNGNQTIEVGVGCADLTACTNFKAIDLSDDWSETRIRLSCFENMGSLRHALVVKGQSDVEFALANVKLKQQSSEAITCE